MGSERLIGTASDRARKGPGVRTPGLLPARGHEAVLTLQQSVGNRAVASMLQRVKFERGVRVEFSKTDAETAKRWVRELEAGDWKHASISHMQKLARRLAHLARQVEAAQSKDAAAELWEYKRRAERAGLKTEIRESNTLGDKYSDAAVSEGMEGHAALAPGPPRESDDDS